MKWPKLIGWFSRAQRARDMAMYYVQNQPIPGPSDEWIQQAQAIAHWIETGEAPPKGSGVVRGEFPRKVDNDKPT